MRLYPRQGQTTLDHPDYGHFDAGDDGGFDLPEDVGEQMHAFHVGGRPLWETDIERQRRLAEEELERRRDPQTMLDVMERLLAAAKPAPAPAAKTRAPQAKAHAAKTAA